jgi:hypothetical protein
MNSPPRLRWLSAITLGLVFAGAALSTGCAKTGRVTGRVTLPDGSPLPGGIIQFTPDDSKRNPATAVIKEDGTYSCDVPVGSCTVSIDNRAAGKSSAPIGAGGVSGPPKAGGGGKMAGTKGQPGMQGPPGGRTAGGPSEKELKTGNEEIANRMSQAGADKVGPTVAVPGKAVQINPKYYNGQTSGLSFEVGGGTQTFDVKLDK